MNFNFLQKQEEYEKELDEDKCCICIPIVCGMKVLSLVMVINSLYAFGMLVQGLASGHTETFAMILSIVTMALQAGIIFGMGKWLLNQQSRNFLIFGLYANVGMALLTMAVKGMNADSEAEYNLDIAN